MTRRWTYQQIIDRMNEIGALSKEGRQILFTQCPGHEATGEYFATANPIYICYHCGMKFQVEKDGSFYEWRE